MRDQRSKGGGDSKRENRKNSAVAEIRIRSGKDFE